MATHERLLGDRAVPVDRGRQYRDTDGVSWRVRELQSSDRPPALYFENEISFRRVTHYPPDWRDLPTGELEILSHGT